jgi:hypothetical protein
MCSNKGCNTTTNTCNCNNTCDPCNQQPCGCQFEVDAACVRYTGNELPCIDLIAGETLEQALESINDKMCDLYPATDGVDGDSAYQIWLDLGNEGTEEDFIDSLVGPAGSTGATGPAGPAGPVGPQGLPGQDCECQVNAFYSERVLGPESVGTIDSPIIIDGTTYTVPVGGDGTYRIFYSVQVHFEDFPGGITGQLFIKPLINGTPYTIIRESYVAFVEGGGVLREGTSLNLQLNLNAGDIFALQGSSNEPGVQYLKNATLIIDKLPTP